MRPETRQCERIEDKRLKTKDGSRAVLCPLSFVPYPLSFVLLLPRPQKAPRTDRMESRHLGGCYTAMNSKLWQGRPLPCGKAEAALLHPTSINHIPQINPPHKPHIGNTSNWQHWHIGNTPPAPPHPFTP